MSARLDAIASVLGGHYWTVRPFVPLPLAARRSRVWRNSSAPTWPQAAPEVPAPAQAWSLTPETSTSSVSARNAAWTTALSPAAFPGNAVGAITCRGKGAIPALPTRSEVEAFLQAQPTP